MEITFYATEFTISFDVDGNVDLSAEVAGKLTHDDKREVILRRDYL